MDLANMPVFFAGLGALGLTTVLLTAMSFIRTPGRAMLPAGIAVTITTVVGVFCTVGGIWGSIGIAWLGGIIAMLIALTIM